MATSAFRPYGPSHLIVIFLTITLPLALATWGRRSRRADRAISLAISFVLAANYLVYLLLVPRSAGLSWRQMLPMQMCDWAIVVAIVALLTNNRRCFEVAYFWGIGGTLQAVLTPNLQAPFPDFRFLSFFVAHGGIIVAVVYLMLVRRLRPVPASIVRAFLWSEFYFLATVAVDAWTGVNYGFLLHKPEAKTLLSLLADDRALYLFQMHLIALVFFLTLYMPFALYDLADRRRNVQLRQGIA